MRESHNVCVCVCVQGVCGWRRLINELYHFFQKLHMLFMYVRISFANRFAHLILWWNWQWRTRWIHDGKLNFPNFLSDMEIRRFLIMSDTHTHSNTRITPSTMGRFVLLPSNYYGKIKALSRQANTPPLNLLSFLHSSQWHCKLLDKITTIASECVCVSDEKRYIDDCDTYTAKGRYLFVYTIYK